MGIEAQSASSEPAVFRPALGLRICLMLALALAGVGLLSGIFALLPLHDGVSVVLQALYGLMVVLIAYGMYLMLSTKYRVVDGVLHMHEGGLVRRIELESISMIRLKGAPFRGKPFGLGSHGVYIYYGLGVRHRDRMARFAPKDVDGFLAAIGAHRTGSGDVKRCVLDKQRGEV